MKLRVLRFALITIGVLVAPVAGIEAYAADKVSEQAVQQFVDSYVAPASPNGQIARWKMVVCPEAYGLDPDANAAVVKRVKEVAALVDAGAKPKEPCQVNIRIAFSSQPQKLLDDIRDHTPDDLGFHMPNKVKEAATVLHPIQAWYITATEDYRGATIRDSAYDTGNGVCNPGDVSRSGGNGGCASTAKGSNIASGFSRVLGGGTIVIDVTKFTKSSLADATDYIAMVALAQTNSFSDCRDLPSVTNLMAETCDASKKAKALTEADIAYLRALYRIDLTSTFRRQKTSLVKLMEKNLGQP